MSRRYDATAPALPAPSAGSVLGHDFRCALTASAAGGVLMLVAVGIIAVAVRDWSWSWLAWVLAGVGLPWLVLVVGSLVELVRNMLERIVQRDLDGDGYVGPAPRFVAISPYRGRMALERDTIERDRASLETFIRGCAVDTSLRRWEPAIGRDTYQEYRDRLIDSGWAEWIKPGNVKAGWRLTAPADETVAGLWT